MSRSKLQLATLCVLTAVMLASAGCQGMLGAKTPNKPINLFNGKDLDNWQLVLSDPNVDVSSVWSVREGVVHCTGKPNGYMRTKTAYRDYKLHVEWRWAAEPANSGVLLHMSGHDKVWPPCIEAQLKAGNAGDFVLMNGTGLTVDGENKQDTTKQFVGIRKTQASSEKPAGQWNTYNIFCKGDTITVMVNGVLQNMGGAASVTSGWIGLQSEGGPIEFRSVYIDPLE